MGRIHTKYDDRQDMPACEEPRSVVDVHGLGDMPGHLIRRLHQIGVAHFMERTRDEGITPVQYGTLIAARNFPGIDQRSLGSLLAFDRSTIGDVIQRLDQRGLLRREDDQIDRRAKRVFLTDAGHDLLDRVDPLIAASQDALLAPLSEGERAILMFLLRKLAMPDGEANLRPHRPMKTLETV